MAALAAFGLSIGAVPAHAGLWTQGQTESPEPTCTEFPPNTARQLSTGSCVRSTLDESDSLLRDVTRYEDWHLTLQARETVRIDLESPGHTGATSGAQASTPQSDRFFDTYLEVRRSGEAEPLAENDDSIGSLNSSLVFTAPAAGNYIVRARAYYGGTGDYTLSVVVTEPAAPPVSVSAFAGAVASGTIGAGAPTDNSLGMPYRYALHSFSGIPGNHVRIDLSANGDSTATLQLLDLDNRVLATGFGNSLVAALPNRVRAAASANSAPPQAQEFRIRVMVSDEGDFAYNLTLAQRAAPTSDRPIRTRVGAPPVTGSLGLDSSAAVDLFGEGQISYLYDLYRVRVRRGEPIIITLDSSDFDAFLEAGSLSVIGFAPATSDDDGGAEGLNSLLRIEPERNGDLFLRVRPLGHDVGQYRLTIRRDQASSNPQP